MARTPTQNVREKAAIRQIYKTKVEGKNKVGRSRKIWKEKMRYK